MSAQVPTSSPAPNLVRRSRKRRMRRVRAGPLARGAQLPHRDVFVETRDKTRVENEQREPLFPKMRIATEGAFLTSQGNYVQTVYVDLSGAVEADRLCLVKAIEPQYGLATASTIRLSRILPPFG